MLGLRADSGPRWLAALLTTALVSMFSAAGHHTHGPFVAIPDSVSCTAIGQAEALPCPACALAHTPVAPGEASFDVAPPAAAPRPVEIDPPELPGLLERLTRAPRAPPGSA